MKALKVALLLAVVALQIALMVQRHEQIRQEREIEARLQAALGGRTK